MKNKKISKTKSNINKENENSKKKNSKINKYNTSEKLSDINSIIDLYLSIGNEKQDSNGYISIEDLLKSNKIIENSYSKEDLIAELKSNENIEIDSSNNKIRKKGNKQSITELKLLNQKRKLSDFSKSEINNEIEDFRNKITIDPIVFKITSEKEINEENFWYLIKQNFSNENPDLKISYCTFKNKLGFLTILYRCDQEDKIKFNKELKVNDYILIIEKAEGDDLIDFWKFNEKNYIRVNNLKIENKNENYNFHENEILKNSINLGGFEFKNINDIKKKAKSIISNSFDNEPLKELDLKFVEDILKFHPKYDEKIKDMKFISVGKNSQFNNSRCFIIVKNNDIYEDFSVQKCIKVIASKNC